MRKNLCACLVALLLAAPNTWAAKRAPIIPGNRSMSPASQNARDANVEEVERRLLVAEMIANLAAASGDSKLAAHRS